MSGLHIEGKLFKEYFVIYITKRKRENMDELLIKRCNEFTHEALKNNIKIDRICMFVKDYQRKYLSLKEKDPNAAKIYTIAVWIALYYNKDTGKFNIIQ